jgi:hypothetical protein
MSKDVLKLALAALECKDGWGSSIRSQKDRAITAIKQALEQPVQEPEAWLQIGLAPFHDGDVIARKTKPKEWNPEWWRFEPLYTTPPAQEFVCSTGLCHFRKPLTDEQISAIGSKIFPSTWNTRHVEFARAIEAKLKEKNT